MTLDPSAGLTCPPPEPPDDLEAVVSHALNEDIGAGDLSADLIPARHWVEAEVITREAAVLCGGPWFDACFRQLDRQVIVGWHFQEGAELAPDTRVCSLGGPARAVLSAERTALNFLQTLSGTATLTRRHVALLAGTRCRLLDTRKTLPGLRLAQKYAVNVGGGQNHRLGLYDAIMVKENHIAAAGSLTAAVTAARLIHPNARIIVEVEGLEELVEALANGITHILLDNFDVATIRDAVVFTAGRAQLEASGGVTPDNLPELAATGVDFISMGGLTKHVRAIDFSLRISAE